jgi:hypothetical protein
VVRGGHVFGNLIDQPHEPRRCGGPEHHGAFEDASYRFAPSSKDRATAQFNQSFINELVHHIQILVNFGTPQFFIKNRGRTSTLENSKTQPNGI